MIVELLKSLVNQAGIIVLLAILMSRFHFFRNLIIQEKLPHRNIIILTIFFSCFGILGTYLGIPVKGALANSRVVGVFVGGLIGGPVVGIFSGLIAGIHRWAIDIGGFTAFACMIATFCEGTFAGILHSRFKRSEKKWLFALYGGLLAEILQMVLLLILVKPFNEAWNLVAIISLPMILANALGISMVIAIVDWIFKEQDRIAASQSRAVLKIANKTINLLRKGLTEETTATAARIIKDTIGASAVSFTNTEKILSHIGIASDHHVAGSKIITELTKSVLRDGQTRIAHTRNDIDCPYENCTLKGAVIVPLKIRGNIIGALKIYKEKNYSITSSDVEIANGLASLFSTQIELSRLEEQEKLLTQAEINTLQAQINPHFLFNAMNTIISLIRTSPDKARDLLIKLADYFRKNLNHSEDIELFHEIENIKNYLEIEKARFGNKLNVSYNIPEEIQCRIPPFSIQPLVENALKHGLMSRVKGGSIEISAKKNSRYIYISVKDNGVGMSAEHCTNLLSENTKTSSVGLRNVHKRLLYRYGSNSGLKITSEPDKGTTVLITIPMESCQ